MSSQRSGRRSLVFASVGAAMLSACTVLTRPASVSAREEKVFRFINAGIGPVERPLRAVMQMGNGLSAAVVPALMLASGRSKSDAVRTAVAGFGSWQLAKAVKEIVPRARPAAMLDSVHLRDGDPGGGGFVSGHATVAMATAVVVVQGSTKPVQVGLIAAAAAAGAARVHVGAHLPLDVVGGAALGLICGTVCLHLPLPAKLDGRELDSGR